VAAVIARKLFGGGAFPVRLSLWGPPLYTFFQVMTLEELVNGHRRRLMEFNPFAWLYFGTFILIATFIDAESV